MGHQITSIKINIFFSYKNDPKNMLTKKIPYLKKQITKSKKKKLKKNNVFQNLKYNNIKLSVALFYCCLLFLTLK